MRFKLILVGIGANVSTFTPKKVSWAGGWGKYFGAQKVTQCFTYDNFLLFQTKKDPQLSGIAKTLAINIILQGEFVTKILQL